MIHGGGRSDASWSLLTQQASPVSRRLAASLGRIVFTLVWDRGSASGCSPPRLTATQLPSAVLPVDASEGFGLSPFDFMYVYSQENGSPGPVSSSGLGALRFSSAVLLCARTWKSGLLYLLSHGIEAPAAARLTLPHSCRGWHISHHKTPESGLINLAAIRQAPPTQWRGTVNAQRHPPRTPRPEGRDSNSPRSLGVRSAAPGTDMLPRLALPPATPDPEPGRGP